MALDVLERPEPAFRHFVPVRMQFKIADGGEDVHQLAFDVRLENVSGQMHGVEIIESELLLRLTEQGLDNAFSIADVAPYGSVPVARKQVFFHRALLQVKLAVAVKDMQVNDRMQGLVTPVTPGPRKRCRTGPRQAASPTPPPPLSPSVAGEQVQGRRKDIRVPSYPMYDIEFFRSVKDGVDEIRGDMRQKDEYRQEEYNGAQNRCDGNPPPPSSTLHYLRSFLQ